MLERLANKSETQENVRCFFFFQEKKLKLNQMEKFSD